MSSTSATRAGSSATATVGTYECIVCLDQKALSTRQPWPRLTTGNGELLREGDCGHPTCSDCMREFVTSRVDEGTVHSICCPYEGCKNEIFESDVARMVDARVASRFAELRAQDYSRRAAMIVADAEDGTDYDMLRVLHETARLCPRCSVVIQRSSGCDHFFCRCGHSFNWVTAPRAVGGDKKKYGRVITLAQSLQVPLAEAEKYGNAKTMVKGVKIADALGITVEEAVTLHTQARSGDQLARDLIRATRQGDPLELKRLKEQHSAESGSGPQVPASAAA